jgi:hypothetical protein
LISLISGLLSIYIWGVICTLIFFLFAIGRFYQEKSRQRSFYGLFLIPIGLFAAAGIEYAWLAPAITGDFWGDILRFVGGVVLGGTGLFLLNLMIGGRRR